MGTEGKCPTCGGRFVVPPVANAKNPATSAPRIATPRRRKRVTDKRAITAAIFGTCLIVAFCLVAVSRRHHPATSDSALAPRTPTPASQVITPVATPTRTPEAIPPAATPTNRAFDQAAEEGRNIADRILAKYPRLKVSVLSGNNHPKPDGFEVHGSGTLYPTVGFILPLAEWNSLPKTQQISLTSYVESRIAFIRAHPDDYTTSRSTGSFHQRELWAIRQIAKDAWFIGTTTTFPDDPQGNLYLDRMLVQGDGAWMHSDSHSGTKASEFRK